MMYHKHTPAARARYLFMELCLLEQLLDHLWSPSCADEVSRRRLCDAELCALADGIGVVLHAEYTYIARPDGLADYNALVLAAAKLPCAESAAGAAPRGTRLGAREEARLLNARVDGDVARFKGVFVKAVMS